MGQRINASEIFSLYALLNIRLKDNYLLMFSTNRAKNCVTLNVAILFSLINPMYTELYLKRTVTCVINFCFFD